MAPGGPRVFLREEEEPGGGGGGGIGGAHPPAQPNQTSQPAPINYRWVGHDDLVHHWLRLKVAWLCFDI